MYKRTTTDSKAKNTSKQERLENLEKLVPNGKKKWVRYDEGAVLYSMGYHSFRKLTLKLAEKASEIVIGFLVLLVGFGIVYSICTQNWTNLLIFAIIGGAIIAAMFICVVAEETCDGLREKISNL